MRNTKIKELARHTQDLSNRIAKTGSESNKLPEPTRSTALNLKDVGKATKIRFEFENGDVMSAEGNHANTIFRYLSECQMLCMLNSLCFYTGPPLNIVKPSIDKSVNEQEPDTSKKKAKVKP